MNITPEQIPDEVVEAAFNAMNPMRFATYPQQELAVALAAALPVLLGEPVGRVINGFTDAMGGSVRVAEWSGDEPPLNSLLYTLPTPETPNA